MKRFAPRHIAIGVMVCGLAGAFYLAMQPALRGGQARQCNDNLRQIGIAMMIYVRDYDEKFPQSDDWMDAMMPYSRGFSRNPESVESVKARFACPTTGSFYAYNALLAGQQVADLKPTTPWVFEVNAGAGRYNLSDDGSLWPQTPVHRTLWGDGNNVYDARYPPPAAPSVLGAKPDFRPGIRPTVAPKPRAKTIKPKP